MFREKREPSFDGGGGHSAQAEDALFSTGRRRMVREQLSEPELTDQRVLEAMAKVPRHEFIPEASRLSAYDDRAVPIEHGQTISQPYIVALMTTLLETKPTDRVLEIGTGSGYQAAVLSWLVKEVFSMEIIEPLARRAEADLRRLGYSNIRLRIGDGSQGWPEAAPFDGIIVTCAPRGVPRPLFSQLKDGGRLVVPVGPWERQDMVSIRRNGGKFLQESVLPVRFVPMTGKVW